MRNTPDLLTENINSIVLRIKADGTVLYINPFAEQFFGITEQACIGKDVSAVVGACSNFLEMLNGLRRTPDAHLFVDNEMRCSNDVSRWMSWSNKVLRDENGVIDEIILSGNEITKYKLFEHDLKDTNERFKVMLENIQTGVLIVDPLEMVVMYANNLAAEILGMPREMIIGEKCEKFCHSRSSQCAAVAAKENMAFKQNGETSFIRMDGRKVYIIKNYAMVNFRGEEFILESFINISDKKHTEERLVNASRQIENLLSSIVSVLIGVSIDDYVTHWNKVAENTFGITEEEVLNTRFPMCSIVWEWERIYEGIADSILMNHVSILQNVSYESKDGRKGYLDVTINPIRDKNSELTGFLIFGEDVTEKELNKKLIDEIQHRKQVESELKVANVQLERLATEDHLTGLFNRRCFMEKFESEFQRSKRYHTLLSFLLLDIDHFKKVNDTHGHLVGDRVLAEVSRNIKSMIRSTDVAGRYGGEEFCIFLPLADVDKAAMVAEKLRIAVSNALFPGLEGFSVTCSIGVSAIDERDEDPTNIIKRADVALYDAKNGGRNRVVTSK